MSGFQKKQLMNAYIGVYQGCSKIDWNYMPYNPIASNAGFGGGDTICGARQSFSLGMQGPCMTLDSEMATSHLAVCLASQAVVPVNKDWSAAGNDTPASVAGGSYVMCSPYQWPRHGYWMNPVGRCLTFDASANGHVRGDCVASIVVRGWNSYVDGQLVLTDKPEGCGAICGWRMNNNGGGASITAPNAAQEQECVNTALRQASLTPFDIDSVECHGASSLLYDAIEVTALGLALRSEAGGHNHEVLTMGSAKANHCTAYEAAGMVSFLKVFLSQKRVTMVPNIHLRQLNPSMELDTSPLVLNTESMPYRNKYSYHSTTGRSLSGMNAHVICWGKADQAYNPPEKETIERQAFCFWPGGGGETSPALKPAFGGAGYMIVGSWLNWEQAEPMQRETDGSFSHIVTLGENRFETFQIWIDGDVDRALGPSELRATSGSAVAGPFPADECDFWTIDARTDEETDTPSRDEGRPGDQFKVTLKIAGKYCSVSWDKVYAVTEEFEVMKTQGRGTYYIWMSSNEMIEMMSSPDISGVYTAEVGPVPPGGGRFQIIRNMDVSQVFHPSPRNLEEVAGPDMGSDLSWLLAVGDKTEGSKNVFKVEFTRTVTFDADTASISIEELRREPWPKLSTL